MPKSPAKAKPSLDLFDPSAPKPFIVSVSARALFDLEDSHKVFEELGEKAFAEYQRERENEPLQPGAAYSMIKKLLDINDRLPPDARRFEVILMSRNSPETGTRVFNTLDKLDLKIMRAVFTSGRSPSRYFKAIDPDLFLSSNPVEVRNALAAGIAGATIQPRPFAQPNDSEIRIAFDGDAVLFSDEAEKVHKDGGLDMFRAHEIEHADRPLPDGPFRKFLEMIHAIQSHFPAEDCPVRTALVTARSIPAHKRALNTLRSWKVRVDELHLLGGKNKGPYLEAFGADLFFDDSQHNIDNAMSSSIPCGHVPFGVRNELGADERNFTGGATAAAPGKGPR